MRKGGGDDDPYLIGLAWSSTILQEQQKYEKSHSCNQGLPRKVEEKRWKRFWKQHSICDPLTDTIFETLAM